MRVKTISFAVFCDSAPLVLTVRCRTVANTLSIGLEVRKWPQCSAGKSKNASIACLFFVRQATPFGYLTPYFSEKTANAASASARVPACWMSSRSDLTAGAICLGKQFWTFFTLCTQHRWCFVPGNVLSSAFQNPMAPSPTAISGATDSPRPLMSVSNSCQLCALSRKPT